jgi:DnaJ-class molecular chaperone
MDYKTAFRVLGVNAPIEREDLKKEYKALAKVHHPDIQGGDKII